MYFYELVDFTIGGACSLVLDLAWANIPKFFFFLKKKTEIVRNLETLGRNKLR